MVNTMLNVTLKSVDDGAEFKINEGLCIVGRDSSCDIVLGFGYPSREHAQFIQSGGQLLLKDLGSTNGTFVNNQRIYKATAVRSGDVIKFGAAGFYLHSDHLGDATVIANKSSAPKLDSSFIVMDEQNKDPNETVIQQEYKLPHGWPADDTVTQKMFQSGPNKQYLELIDQRIQNRFVGDDQVYIAALVFNPNNDTPTIYGISLESQQQAMSIGRSHKCMFTINTPSVSEHHADLFYDQGHWILKDHNSTNGIRVDGDLHTDIHLKHGSSVFLGQVEMIFREISWAL